MHKFNDKNLALSYDLFILCMLILVLVSDIVRYYPICIISQSCCVVVWVIYMIINRSQYKNNNKENEDK